MSHTRLLAKVATQPHRKTSSSGSSPSAAAPRRKVGAAADDQSMIDSAKPSSSRWMGCGSPGGEASACTARQISTRM